MFPSLLQERSGKRQIRITRFIHLKGDGPTILSNGDVPGVFPVSSGEALEPHRRDLRRPANPTAEQFGS